MNSSIHPSFHRKQGCGHLGLVQAAFWLEVGFTLATVPLAHIHIWGQFGVTNWPVWFGPHCDTHARTRHPLTPSLQSRWCACFGTGGGNWRNPTKTPRPGIRPQACWDEAAVLTSGPPDIPPDSDTPYRCLTAPPHYRPSLFPLCLK